MPRSSPTTRQRCLPAFQREHAQQVVEGKADIAAGVRLRSERHEELALQADDVIDPETAGVAHVRAQQLRERREIAAQADRIERQHAPLLALGLKIIGRRAAAQAGNIGILIHPGIRAVRIDPHREIADQADIHAGSACGVRSLAQLPVGEELNVAMKGGAFLHARIEHARRRLRTAKIGRPILPREAVLLGERGEQRKPFQRLALDGDEFGELGRFGLLPETGEQHFQPRLLGAPDAGVVDEIACTQPRGRTDQLVDTGNVSRARFCANIDVERIEEQPAGRRIGTGVFGSIREERVERIERNRTPAGLADRRA